MSEREGERERESERDETGKKGRDKDSSTRDMPFFLSSSSIKKKSREIPFLQK